MLPGHLSGLNEMFGKSIMDLALASPLDFNRLHAVSLSKQEESRFKKQRFAGKYGNSLRSNSRISNPASRFFLSYGPSHL